MAAGASDCDLETTRSNSLRGDVLGGRSIDGDDGGEARTVSFDERADTAEIAFALFADVTGEDDGFVGADAAFGERFGDADQGGETRAIIGDAGTDQAIAIFFDADFSAGGKDGVEMRGQEDDAVGVGARAFGDYVAGFVDGDFQAE